MEVLVAMMLMSMVTVVAALGLRLAVNAWERGEREGDSKQILMTVPSLLENQLELIRTQAAFGEKGTKKLQFCGGERMIGFFTTFSRQSSPFKGLFFVCYLYDEQEKKLEFYQQIVTRFEEPFKESFRLDQSFLSKLEPVGTIEGVTEMSFGYAPKESEELYTDDSAFENEWKCDAGSLPFMVFLQMQVENGAEGKWFFVTSGSKT